MVAQQKTKEGSPDSGVVEVGTIPSTNDNTGSPKSRLAMLKRSSARTKANPANNDPFRFQGSGIDFKGKFIGERDVAEARGDAICAEAMQLAKASVKSSGSHKQRITLNISIEGLKIKDQKTEAVIYNFPVSKISFIARDTTDARAFGFIFGTSNSKYKFYGIKTAQTADHAVLTIRDMFQVVFEMKKKQIQELKQKQEEQQNAEDPEGSEEVLSVDQCFKNTRRESSTKNDDAAAPSDCRMDGGVAVADLLDLNTEMNPFNDSFFNSATPSGGFSSIFDNEIELAWNAGGSQLRALTPEEDVFSTAAVNGDSLVSSSAIPIVPVPIAPAPIAPAPVAVPVVAETNGVHTNPFEHIPNEHIFSPPKPDILRMAVADMFDLKPAANPFNDSFFNSAAPSTRFSTNFDTKPDLAWNASDNQQQRVTTLEEAFSKLVNMDQLVPSTNPTNNMGGVRKNPFEHIINPPKIPMNALVTTTAHFH